MLARFSNCEEAFARTGLGHLEGGCERAMLLLALLAHVAHALRSPAAAFAHRENDAMRGAARAHETAAAKCHLCQSCHDRKSGYGGVFSDALPDSAVVAPVLDGPLPVAQLAALHSRIGNPHRPGHGLQPRRYRGALGVPVGAGDAALGERCIQLLRPGLGLVRGIAVADEGLLSRLDPEHGAHPHGRLNHEVSRRVAVQAASVREEDATVAPPLLLLHLPQLNSVVQLVGSSLLLRDGEHNIRGQDQTVRLVRLSITIKVPGSIN